MSTAIPPIEERRKPGLSETLTAHPRSPISCQSCGWVASEPDRYPPNLTRYLQRWIEHDPDDRKTDVVVVLCNRCSDRLIEPHARFYTMLAPNQQHPATHPKICFPCRWRDGLTCNSPLRLTRGGPGLRMEQGPPTVAFICGRGPKGRRASGKTILHARVTGCPGFEAVQTECAL